MTCVDKRHMSHRMGSMLHHRFPNGFTDLFMDETDREVSTLTDRAFRSLCVGDDAVYNDELLYGLSPFSCHKPLVGDPHKKSHQKEPKKQGQNKTAQPWKQQQQKNISNMSSFLKALSATEGSCDGMLIKNGGLTDSKGESWDKSALRSIQRELSEFSSDYHANLPDGHYKKHQSGDGSSNKTGKDASLSSKGKNGKSTVKIRKLNIKNFFLHSEFSPFQAWTDFNQFPFGQEDASILPTDNIPKWYDLSFYKELTEAHRKETLHEEEVQIHHTAAPPPTAPKPIPPPPPPKVLPKPTATPAGKRCSSEGGEGCTAPWRRNRSRATSVIQGNQLGMPIQENSLKTLEESLWLAKKETRSVEVKAIEEVSSLASTPFSICQLMTPLIPSRQATETSEILSPSALDLPLRPHSEVKMTPEPPVKRDSYKSLASSILFNLKDNRKRVKSRYSPPKFKTLEVPESTQSPHSDNLKYPQASSEGYASGLSTPAILKDGLTVCTPALDSNSTPIVGHTKQDTDGPLSDDYLLANLLQTKKDAAGGLGEDNPISPFIQSKKSPKAKKQNYPSLNLYKKANPIDSDMKYLVVPPSPGAPLHIDKPSETNHLSPLSQSSELSPKALPTNTGLSPNTLNVNRDRSPKVSPLALEKERLSSNLGKRESNVPEKARRPAQDIKESSKEKASSSQHMSTKDVIRAAREAINAAKNKALSAAQSDSISKPVSDVEELRDMDRREGSAPENTNVLSQSRNEATPSIVKKEPPPVPKRNFAKSDIQLSLDNQLTYTVDQLTNGDSGDATLDLALNEKETIEKQRKPKHVFSARQNNYIKNQRYAVTDEEQGEECEESNLKVNNGREADEKTISPRETRDREHIISDLHALKELGKVRLGDRVLENAKKKLSAFKLDEETKTKNDLISRELRNIKKGMLSMRGNTMSKREIFLQKEKDQSREETFSKIDNNVKVNKALINDNYDKAKMALEEIISDRQKRKYRPTEQDANPMFDEDAEESYATRAELRKKAMNESTTEGTEKQDGSTVELKEKDLKERLSDLRDHNNMRQILSQTEPRLGESHRSGGRFALPGMDQIEDPSFESEEVNLRDFARQISEESGNSLMSNNEGKKRDAPPVPPRIKKAGSRGSSVTKDTDSLKDVDIFDKDVKYEYCAGLAKQEVDSDLSKRDPVQSETSPVKESRSRENKAINLQVDMSPTRDATFENRNAQGTQKVKRKAPLRPDHLNTPDDNVTNHLVADEPETTNRASEETSEHAEAAGENPRDIISPLLLVNGVSINQSPPDQGSLSSKSSYFSVESAMHRNTETESNVYRSLENLIGEVDEVDEDIRNISRNTKEDSDRTELEYYSLSDHENEPELVKPPVKSPQKETEVLYTDSKEGDTTTAEALDQDENNQTPMSPSNIISPTLGIPALFKVKDNTFTNKMRSKTIQPWSPRGSLSGSEKGEESHQVKESLDLPLPKEPDTRASSPIPDETFKPEEVLLHVSSPMPLSPADLQSESPKKPQVGGFLTVPLEEDRLSGVSPLSEGVESLATSAADTSDEMGLSAVVSKVPRERSGSTCSGSESQTGLPKPPVVLPKSEKAVLKAIKIANRRMKKEEAQKSSHKSTQSSSKHRVDRHKSDKSEHKSSRSSKSSERNHREKTEDGYRHNDKNSQEQSEQQPCERRGDRRENRHQTQTDVHQKTRTQSRDPVESSSQNSEVLPSVEPERPGRSSKKHMREKPEQRHYSSDRVISNVPVYKTQQGDRPTSDRPFNRSQSIDRYLGEKVERRLSTDTSMNEKVDLRTQRIEKSIMDELQQRGRAKEKPSRDNPTRRSHSIDAYPNPNPSNLSRQSSYSSHTSQLSRQSSIEHAIVTQSFPMTQRKLLQDPDSGQYFFVDMPVQVKTKTFFDPETGSYVQLPVQPPEGAVTQASTLEVLTQPMVVYHSFVPVPLSPMTQTSIQASHMEPRMRQMHCQEAHPYLEPVYGQPDHMLGEFLGTEELDCPS